MIMMTYIDTVLTSATISCIIVNMNNIGGSGTTSILSIILGITLVWYAERIKK